MAYEVPGFTVGMLLANADLSEKQFRFVDIHTNGNVKLASSGGHVIGTLNNKPQAGEVCTVYNTGIVMVVAEAAIGKGAAVQVGAAGGAVAQTTGQAVGVTLNVSAAADGDIIPVLLVPPAAAPSTNVVGDQTAITALTNSTGNTPDNTIANVTAADAAAGEATAADLTTTNAALAVLEANDADLAGKINELRTALIAAGLLAS